ncbi:hypothetical protein [Paracoccus marcusii]|uniref:hypothetical protein n=1 Tax=Paracoccus marcusii TaxID=59779 RepID=UPI00249175C8|nr:hypothetical protein [Paracoccus marcusii]
MLDIKASVRISFLSLDGILRAVFFPHAGHLPSNWVSISMMDQKHCGSGWIWKEAANSGPSLRSAHRGNASGICMVRRADHGLPGRSVADQWHYTLEMVGVASRADPVCAQRPLADQTRVIFDVEVEREWNGDLGSRTHGQSPFKSIIKS